MYFVPSSLDLVLFEVRALYLLEMLVVAHDHELVKRARAENGSGVELEWRSAIILSYS